MMFGFGDNVKKSLSVPDSYNMNCPFCEFLVGKKDTKFHLNFNTRKFCYRCPRCNSSGKLSDLKEINLISSPQINGLEGLKKKAEFLLNKKVSIHFDLDQISWPLTEEKTPIAYQYIKLRGFTDQDIEIYHLRVGIPYWDDHKDYEVRKWSGRILFPFFKNSECFYFVGRSYINVEPRYLNSEGSKTFALYNIEKVKDRCIICEGILSSISAEKVTGIPSIALLGKSINDFQISMIRNKCSEVYLSLDGDTSPLERELIKNRLMKVGLKVWIIELPLIKSGDKKLKDPDDFKSNYFDYFKSAYPAHLFNLNLNQLACI